MASRIIGTWVTRGVGRVGGALLSAVMQRAAGSVMSSVVPAVTFTANTVVLILFPVLDEAVGVPAEFRTRRLNQLLRLCVGVGGALSTSCDTSSKLGELLNTPRRRAALLTAAKARRQMAFSFK